MSMNKHTDDGQIQIELPEDIATGIYANWASIAHSHSEFVVDFVTMLPGLPKAKVRSRIILTPEHAYSLLQALQDNIRKYEASYGASFGSQPQEGSTIPFPLGKNKKGEA